MRRKTAILLVAIISILSANAERILETVLDPANPQQQNVRYEGKVLIAGHNDSYLLSYDDVTFSHISYPLVAGLAMRFDSYRNPLTQFESAIFFALGPTPGSASPRYLFKFNGSFSRIGITGDINSNCIVYGRNLYYLSNVSGTTRLFRYSAGVVTEVVGASIPVSRSYQLLAAQGNLYITGQATTRGTVNFIRRYNGSSFLTLPWTSAGTNADGVFGVPGTNRVYFTSHERILYYNGTSVSEVFFNAGEAIFARIWQNDLFFTTGIGSLPGRGNHLYRLSGPALSELFLPSGYRVAPVPSTNPEIYGGFLHIGAEFSDGSSHLFRFNGSSFDDLYTIPTPTVSLSSGVRLYLREGNLIIQPNFPNGNHAFEYNGTDFTEIIAPAGRLLFPYINSTDCNHLWLNYYSDASGIHWAYAKESKDCSPIPPGPGPIAVIPDSLRTYERFEMAIFGPERGWCWSEIIIDWHIVPVCELPPCPEPQYQLRMIDANNGTAWSERFSKPTKFAVPLKDEQAFRTILSSPESKTDLIIFEPDLLPQGIELIKLAMKPKQGLFAISTTTRKNEPVPLKVALLDENGKEIWMQTFTAPFEMKITATVQKSGSTLVFSIPDNGTKFITRRSPKP